MKENIFVIQSVNDLAPDSGGPSKTVSGLSKGLIDLGVNIKVIANSKQKLNLNNSLSLKDLILYRSDISFLSPLKERDLNLLLGKIFNGKKNNLIFHDNGIWLPSNNTICNFAIKNKIKLLISPHGMLEPWSLKYKKLKKSIAWNIYQKRNLRRADIIHACSEMEAENILKLNLKKPIAIIPNGIDQPMKDYLSNHNFFNEEKKQNYLFKNLLYIGRIHPKKGLLNLLIATKDLLIRESWRLTIVGFPELNYDLVLRGFVKNNNLEDYVKILEPVSGKDLFNLYQSATYFILPSYSENFGLVVAEALNFGIPVIATKGTPWEILEKTNSGWWVQPKVDEIKQAINRAIFLKENEYLRMSENAKKLSENYNWEDISQKFITLYSWILGNGTKPDFVI